MNQKKVKSLRREVADYALKHKLPFLKRIYKKAKKEYNNTPRNKR
jgi:hypothetical protein